MWAQFQLEIWRQHIRAGWREFSDEALQVSAQLGLIEMIRTGCTSVMDHFYSGSPSPYMGAMEVVEAMANAGMRGGLALTLSDQQYDHTVGLDTTTLSAAAKDEVGRISRLEGKTTLDDFINFAARFANTRILLHQSLVLLRRTDVRRNSWCAVPRSRSDLKPMVHMHVCETKGQFFQGQKLFGCSPVAHLDRIGVLNDRLSMAHCVWLTDDDMGRVAARGTTVIHHPGQQWKLRQRPYALRRDAAPERSVWLATDGSGSNDTQNMFEAMRLAGILTTATPRIMSSGRRPKYSARGDVAKRPCARLWRTPGGALSQPANSPTWS